LAPLAAAVFHVLGIFNYFLVFWCDSKKIPLQLPKAPTSEFFTLASPILGDMISISPCFPLALTISLVPSFGRGGVGFP